MSPTALPSTRRDRWRTGGRRARRWTGSILPGSTSGRRRRAARESDRSSTDLAVDEPGRNPSRSTPCDFGRRNSYSVQSAHSRARYSAAPAGGHAHTNSAVTRSVWVAQGDERGVLMRRMVVGVLAPLLIATMIPATASAASPKQLIKGYNEQILGMTDTDQFLFDDGCVGGTSSHDPLYIVVPLTDPPSAQGACSATTGAPIIVSPAGITCWQPTSEAARTECEDAWNDPEHALRSASVTVDGTAQRLELTRVDGTFTFPEGAILDAPGLNTVYYGITEAVKIHGLNP